MDAVQILLSVTLVITTVFLIVVGVQLFLALRDVRRTLGRANTIIDSFEKVGSGLEHGFSEVSGFLSGVKGLFKFIDIVKRKKDDELQTP